MSIIIASDFASLKEKLIEKYGLNNIKFFETDEFLLPDAQAVISEAYIAESSQKIIILIAYSYSIQAQNALLKIIEEPPRNIKFIIIANSKSSLLPTIRSRLPVTVLESKSTKYELDLDLKRLTIKDINHFISNIELKEKNGEVGKIELKAIISAIVDRWHELGYTFDLYEYEYIFKLITLTDLNAKPPAVLTPLLLTILHKGKS